MRRYALTTAAAALASLSLVAAHPAGAVKAATGALHTAGNTIVDSNGKPVVLKGLHRDGTQGGPSTSSTPVTADELSWMGSSRKAGWGASVVRVPVGAAQWTGLCTSLSNTPTAYRKKIDAEVTTLTKQGITVLLDLHSTTADCTSIDRHAMPDATVTKAFWTNAATHYASNPRVAFELYNEPHFVSDYTWLRGTLLPTQQDCDATMPLTDVAGRAALATCRLSAPHYQAIGMQDLYDLVTKQAPGHLLVVDAPGYASKVPTQLITTSANNLVYAFHPYTCSVPGASCDTTARAHANTTLLDAWKAFGTTHAVLATELGWPVYAKGYAEGYTDGSTYYRETLAYMKAQKWGWIAFAWDGNTGGGFSLIKDKITYAPNSTGKPVFDALRAR